LVGIKIARQTIPEAATLKGLIDSHDANHKVGTEAIL